MMILDLHHQGLSVSAIARRTGRDPKTVRKYIERGLEPPAYGPRQVGRPSKLAPYLDYLRERVAAFPDLSAVRLTRELRERGYKGAYTAVKRSVAADPAGEPAEAVRGPLRDAAGLPVNGGAKSDQWAAQKSATRRAAHSLGNRLTASVRRRRWRLGCGSG